MLHDYLFSIGDRIFLIDCELTSDGLIANLSSFAAYLEAGEYDIGANLIKPSYKIEITDAFFSEESYAADYPIIFKVIEQYEYNS